MSSTKEVVRAFLAEADVTTPFCSYSWGGKLVETASLCIDTELYYILTL